MKVLDVQAFHEGINKSLERIQFLDEQLKQVQRGVEGIATSLNESLKGRTGYSIIMLFKEYHLPFVLFLTQFIVNYKQSLTAIQHALHEFEPAQNGFISESFLENDVEQGLRNLEITTTELIDEINGALDAISDIVHLPQIQNEELLFNMTLAKNQYKETIQQLYAFDQQQASSLEPLEKDIESMERFLSDLEGKFQLLESGFSRNNGLVELPEGLSLNDSKFRHKEIFATVDQVKDVTETEVEDTINTHDIFTYFSKLNQGLFFTDLSFIAGKLIITTSAFASGTLKIVYKGNPTMFQKFKGDYQFYLKADPTWTSRGNYASKFASTLRNFQKLETPSKNPALNYIQKRLSAYNGPAEFLKVQAGFSKEWHNIPIKKGSDFIGTVPDQVTLSVKDTMANKAMSKGWKGTAKAIPIAGHAITITANATEFVAPENENKSLAEKSGRFLAGAGADTFSVGAGAALGVRFGKAFGPKGMVIGALAGGLGGGIISMIPAISEGVRDLGEEIGRLAKQGFGKIKKAFKSIKSWFK
ncbi:LXG domain-containing protein [Bacillus aquiflavi]|uniref:LXG domain-containing protein n=1 Tax=Bacillus aquiflavi TaxID=2672567 RepID=A0A6B3VYG6_9BACI|nr:LXG domain-containing protein [Bacillus aquiflavi]MBA4538804.1 LXG domain-containing protein [Bacillus aquiflavi]NEY83159.1 hypothetical protein [Bacillus aquiflavi]UAC48403.1 LXG domain-containing protein [Bacillus aquiflavi]